MKTRRFRTHRPAVLAERPEAKLGPAARNSGAQGIWGLTDSRARADTPLRRKLGPVAAALTGDDTLEVPYDDQLLERVRSQWQFGDWVSLAALSRDALQHHPDRARVALLVAAGHQQLGDGASARHFTRLAQGWGCSNRLISQILIAGVHNTLGRAAAIAHQPARALGHFTGAIATGTPGTDVRLFAQARASEQLTQLGLLAGASQLAVSALPAIVAPPPEAVRPARWGGFSVRLLSRLFGFS